MFIYAVYVLQLFSNFFNFLWWYGHSKKNPILDYTWKVLNSGFKFYVISVAYINLSLFGSISEIDWCQVVFLFLFRFNSLPIELLEESS